MTELLVVRLGDNEDKCCATLDAAAMELGRKLVAVGQSWFERPDELGLWQKGAQRDIERLVAERLKDDESKRPSPNDLVLRTISSKTVLALLVITPKKLAQLVTEERRSLARSFSLDSRTSLASTDSAPFVLLA